MKERHWEMKHKLTETPKLDGIVRMALEDVKEPAEKPEDEPKYTDPSVKETKLHHTDLNQGAKTPHDSPNSHDATDATEKMPDSKTGSTWFSIKFKSKRSGTAVHVHGPLRANETTNETSISNSTNSSASTDSLLDTIRLHVSQAVALQRLLMKSLQNTSGMIAEGIVTLRRAQDVDADVIDKLVQAIRSTVTTGPENLKLHQLLKFKVEQALAEINIFNKANAKLTNGSDADAATTTMAAKQVFRKRSDILNALEQNEESIAAFDDLVSARLKLANSLTDAHNVTQETLNDMMAEANLTQLEPQFNRIMLLGARIKETKAIANAAAKSAIAERSEAEEAAIKAGVEPLSDIKSDTAV